MGAAEVFNIAVNYFHAKKFTRCNRVLDVTKFVVSKTQCTLLRHLAPPKTIFFPYKFHEKENFFIVPFNLVLNFQDAPPVSIFFITL